MRINRLLCLAALLSLALPALAQDPPETEAPPDRDSTAPDRSSNAVEIVIQFVLPNGERPVNAVAFFVLSDDGAVNETYVTDQRGRVELTDLSPHHSYSLQVSAKSAVYGHTSMRFAPTRNLTLQVRLKAPTEGESKTVSAASAYRPNKRAVNEQRKGYNEIRRGRLDRAEEHMRRAITFDPGYAGPLCDLGVLLMKRKSWAEAEENLRGAIAKDPGMLQAQLNLGITLSYAGKYAEAIAPLRDALRFEPRLVPAQLFLGIALVESGQFAEAETQLNRLAEPNGRPAASAPAAAHAYLGVLYAQTGDFAHAVIHLERYLEIQPAASNAHEVRELLARLRTEIARKQ